MSHVTRVPRVNENHKTRHHGTSAIAEERSLCHCKSLWDRRGRKWVWRQLQLVSPKWRAKKHRPFMYRQLIFLKCWMPRCVCFQHKLRILLTLDNIRRFRKHYHYTSTNRELMPPLKSCIQFSHMLQSWALSKGSYRHWSDHWTAIQNPSPFSPPFRMHLGK